MCVCCVWPRYTVLESSQPLTGAVRQAVLMLTIYRRHSRKCAHRSKGGEWRKCNCPINLEGQLGTKYVRESLGIRSWEAAQVKVRDLEAQSLFPEEVETAPVTVEQAIAMFLRDAKARQISDVWYGKLRYTLETQLAQFATNHGLHYIPEIGLEHLREFRAGWKDSPISAVKRLERIRSFFRFCQASGWISTNPAGAVKAPKVTAPPTLPFDRQEFRSGRFRRSAEIHSS